MHQLCIVDMGSQGYEGVKCYGMIVIAMSRRSAGARCCKSEPWHDPALLSLAQVIHQAEVRIVNGALKTVSTKDYIQRYCQQH